MEGYRGTLSMIYLPKISYRRRYKGRRLTVLSPLFPGYLFTRIELQWRDVRLCPGVIKLVMSGEQPSHVSDEIIAEIRKRERNGAIELPKHRLQHGDRLQIVSGLLEGRREYYVSEASYQHIKVLLLGAERSVRLSPDAVEQI